LRSPPYKFSPHQKFAKGLAKPVYRRMGRLLKDRDVGPPWAIRVTDMSDTMTLRARINDATKTAMKEKDKLRVSTLRLVSAAVKDRDIAARAEDRVEGIDEAEILSLLAKMVKQRKESAQTYEDNGRPELAEREREEIEIIQDYMPKPLSEDEMNAIIANLVETSGATCLKDMGKIMGQLKSGYAGRVDMGKAGAVVKAHLCNTAAG